MAGFFQLAFKEIAAIVARKNILIEGRNHVEEYLVDSRAFANDQEIRLELIDGPQISLEKIGSCPMHLRTWIKMKYKDIKELNVDFACELSMQTQDLRKTIDNKPDIETFWNNLSEKKRGALLNQLSIHPYPKDTLKPTPQISGSKLSIFSLPAQEPRTLLAESTEQKPLISILQQTEIKSEEKLFEPHSVSIDLTHMKKLVFFEATLKQNTINDLMRHLEKISGVPVSE